MFTEQAMNKIETSSPEWATISVVNAKTGEVLGVASSPSFNNNTRDITSYYDPFTSYAYEPGSTMKIFSFMAAMENGIYNGNETYKSGTINVDEAKIKDWNNYGWGEITYDQGFMASSNTAAVNLGLKLGRAKLKDFYNSLGFGSKTGISLPNESEGLVNFRYNTEIAAASYGQGMTISAVQMIQALTTLANDGTMIKPYIVSKIVNSENGSIVLKNKRTEVRKVCNTETVNKMIEIMRGVVDGSFKASTGTGYYIKGYDLVGKTGTAQIASNKGGYLKGSRNYVKSFAGLFPGEDPEIIVYLAASKLTNSNVMKTAIKGLVKDVGTYLNIYDETENTKEDVFTVDSYINKDTTSEAENINNSNMEAIIIGEGNKIISQYPTEGTTLNLGNKIFLKTNDTSYKMPNIKGWSRGDVLVFAKMINLNVNFDGYGYVKSYDVKNDSVIDINNPLNVVLEPKYKEETKKED
mgnify:FL=1